MAVNNKFTAVKRAFAKGRAFNERSICLSQSGLRASPTNERTRDE
jgi:hypothetical protein